MSEVRPNPEVPYKVGFAGAICVGKTAVFEAVRDRVPYPKSVFIEDSAQSYFNAFPDIPRPQRNNILIQPVIQAAAMSLEDAAFNPSIASRGSDYLFTDGTVFDPAVRLAAYGDRYGGEMILKRVENRIPGLSKKSYARIWLLSPEGVTYRHHDVSAGTKKLRELQHETFMEFFAEHDIAYQLLSGTLSERTEQVIADLPVFEPSS